MDDVCNNLTFSKVRNDEYFLGRLLTKEEQKKIEYRFGFHLSLTIVNIENAKNITITNFKRIIEINGKKHYIVAFSSNYNSYIKDRTANWQIEKFIKLPQQEVDHVFKQKIHLINIDKVEEWIKEQCM